MPEIDPILAAFVHAMNETAAQPGISVVVDGTWIAGTLIPPRMWMAENAALVRSQLGDQGSALTVFFDYVGETFFPSESELEARGEDRPDDQGPEHLHLRGARAFVGDYRIPVDGGYLRLRLDHVAGWTVGELGPPGQQPAPAPRLT